MNPKWLLKLHANQSRHVSFVCQSAIYQDFHQKPVKTSHTGHLKAFFINILCLFFVLHHFSAVSCPSLSWYIQNGRIDQDLTYGDRNSYGIVARYRCNAGMCVVLGYYSNTAHLYHPANVAIFQRNFRCTEVLKRKPSVLFCYFGL